MARYIIYGAGAVGGNLGAGLFEAGFDVTLIARGAHYEAIASNGLRIDTPAGSRVVRVPIVDDPAKFKFDVDDRVLLAMKSQDTQGALDALRPLVDPRTPICCVQNGVDNERMALRMYENVYGVLVICPATHIEPGVVIASSFPIPGVLDVGRYPAGVDDLAIEFTDAFTAGGFSSVAVENIMDWKYAKLLQNLSNAVEVVLGLETRADEVQRRIRDEGVASLGAAGIGFTAESLFSARSKDVVTIKPVPGLARHTTSSWQSVVRQSGGIESDYLNGEIALLGRTHHVPTPTNSTLQCLANERSRGIGTPGSLDEQTFLQIASQFD